MGKPNEGAPPVDLDTAGWDEIGDAPPVVTDGQYTLMFKGVKLFEKKDKTGYFIRYRVVVQSGPDSGHTVFGMWSLGPDNLWRFKADMNHFALEQPSGLSVLETITELIPQIEDLVVIGKIGSKIRQVKDAETGEFVADPDGQRENNVTRFIGLAI